MSVRRGDVRHAVDRNRPGNRRWPDMVAKAGGKSCSGATRGSNPLGEHSDWTVALAADAQHIY